MCQVSQSLLLTVRFVKAGTLLILSVMSQKGSHLAWGNLSKYLPEKKKKANKSKSLCLASGWMTELSLGTRLRFSLWLLRQLEITPLKGWCALSRSNNFYHFYCDLIWELDHSFVCLPPLLIKSSSKGPFSSSLELFCGFSMVASFCHLSLPLNFEIFLYLLYCGFVYILTYM